MAANEEVAFDSKQPGDGSLVRALCEPGDPREGTDNSNDGWRFVVESARDIVLSIDLNGTILSANRAIPPHTLEKTLGTSCFDYAVPQYREALKCAVRRAVETAEPCQCDFATPGAEGQALQYRADLLPVRPDGRVVVLTLVLTNLSAHKQLEHALQESQASWYDIVCNCPIPIGVGTVDGKVLYANDAILQLTGYSMEEMRAVNLRTLYVDAQSRLDVLERLRRNGAVRHHQVQLRRKDGSAYWAKLNILPFCHGGERAVLTTLEDITERLKAEEVWRETQERFHGLLEREKDILYTLDPEGKITFVSPAVEATLGYQPEEVVGSSFLSLIPTELHARASAAFQTAIEKGEVSGETILLDKNKQSHSIEYSVGAIRKSGEVKAVQGVARDVTELTEARRQADTLRAAVEQSTDGVVVCDLAGKIVYGNRAFAKMHGYTHDELATMRNADLHTQELREEHERRVRLLKERGSWEGENYHVKKDGTVFPAYLSATMLQDSRGKNVGFVAIIRDITKARRIEKELSTYRAKMVRLEQFASLGTCSAMLSHQLNEPLTVVRLALEYSLETLQSTPCPEAVTEHLGAALRGVSKIGSIAKNFRRFARQGVPRARSEVDLNAVADHTVRLFQELARRANTTLCLQGFDSLPPVNLRGDISQLFFVLTENAIQAADGKHSHEVTISGDMRNGHIELRFADDCGGIAPEHQARLFEPFFTTKPPRLGTGLGLPVAQDIVSQDGGDIRVESTPGVGATFVVRLPANGTMRDETAQ